MAGTVSQNPAERINAIAGEPSLESVSAPASPGGNFKLSSDPFLVEKVRDIVGLFLNPSQHALVPCVDEKS